MDRTTEALANYIVSLSYDDLTAAAIHETKKRLIDSFGCAIGGYHGEPALIARRLATASSGVPPARVLGSGQLTSMEMAAFANSVMVRYLDYNDTYISAGGGHPSDMLSAILAVADAHHASGKEVLVATVAAYEVFGALADVVPIRDQGWDHGLFVVLGSAAGAGKLLRLATGQMGDALALAVSANVPTRQTRSGELSMWKGCATAASARAGVFAALLANEGMTGPTEAFEGRHGAWQQVTGPFQMRPLGGGGTPFAVERSHLKYFPTEYHSQAPLWMALSLRRKVRVEEIAAINVQTYYNAYSEIGSEPEKWDPQTRETADHSLPYLLASALRDGNITVATFDDERIRDRSLRPLMSRIKVSENPEFTRRFPADMTSEIEVVTRSGERHVERASHPKGHVRNPMTDADVESKFMEMCEDAMGRDRCREILEAVWSLEDVQDIGGVLELIRIGESQQKSSHQ